MNEDIVQGVTVCHNTAELIINAVCSIKKYHDIPIIIIDGSDHTAAGRECTEACAMLAKRYRRIQHVIIGRNIGHGVGLHQGIFISEREHVLIFDTDIILKKPALKMFPLIQPYYMMGEILTVDNHGNNSSHGIKYVHPYFAMINRKQYFRSAKFINSGAPLLNAMRIMTKREGMLVNIKVSNAVLHLERGTRAVIPASAKYHAAATSAILAG
jgi:hypothetical protein